MIWESIRNLCAVNEENILYNTHKVFIINKVHNKRKCRNLREVLLSVISL